jgi:hypothetical protein
MPKQQEETGLNHMKMPCMISIKLYISSNHAVHVKQYVTIQNMPWLIAKTVTISRALVFVGRMVWHLDWVNQLTWLFW